jgi:hypothetical protein
VLLIQRCRYPKADVVANIKAHGWIGASGIHNLTDARYFTAANELVDLSAMHAPTSANFNFSLGTDAEEMDPRSKRGSCGTFCGFSLLG